MASTKLESPQHPVLPKGKDSPQRDTATPERRAATLPSAHSFFAPPLWPHSSARGQALSPEQRTRLAPAMGERAPLVARIHTDRYAELVTTAWNARAVAAGEDIFFARGEYRPGTAKGDLLIAHEVAHVEQVQQGLLRRPAAKAKGDSATDAIEMQADAKARAATTPLASPAVVQTALEDAAAHKKSASDKAGAKEPTSAKRAAKLSAVDSGDAPLDAAGPGAAGTAPMPSAGASAATAVDGVLMPEPPLSLSPAETARIHQVESQANTAAVTQTTVPTADAEVATAREAVVEPVAEARGQAAAQVVQAVDDRPPPSPEIEKLCDRIREVIRSKRPPDEESLVKAKPEEMAKAAGKEQNQAITQDVNRVAGSYDEVQKTPAAQPAPAPGAMRETSPTVAAVDVRAPQAVPGAVPAPNVSLDADVKASAQKMDDAGMNSEPAKLVEDGPIAQAREAQGSLSEMAQRDPAIVLAEQQSKLATAKADMAALQSQAQQSLAASRREHVGAAQGQKSGMKLSEEQQRTQAGKAAEDIFKSTQELVKKQLDPLPETAMKQWDADVEVLSTRFKQRLKAVENWIAERHSGVGGKVLAFADYLTGLPGWVTMEYDAAEKDFGDGVCERIKDISRSVNAVIKACEGLIEKARQDIAAVYAKLPANLQEWAHAEQARFGQKLDQLKDEAHQTRDAFNKDVTERASAAVQDARQQIHDLREAAKGLLGKLLDALGEFLADPAKFIINGLLKLVGISPSAFWGVVARVQQVVNDIAEDPMRFVNNMVAGIGKGFSQFFDNFGKHLLTGFLDWLFSALRKDGAGLEVPADLSAKSIIKFVLQLLGISWPRVRKLLVEQLGEKTVTVLEKSAGIIATLVTEGIEGLTKLIKDRLDPKTIIDAMIDAGIRYLVDTVATKVAVKILSMLNPAGAIFQAITLIYDVLKWVFTNASRIFSFVEAVVNGMADVVAGNIAGLANSVEQALAMLVPIVIGLFAQILGLDALPRKVADAVKGVHGAVETALRAAIKWVVEQAKKLLEKLGLGGKAKDQDKKGADGEVGETVPFSGGGESHRLFVKVAGKNATLMMASTPRPLTKWLSELEGKVSELPAEKRSQAKSLLGTALSLTRQADSEADQAVAARTPDKTPTQQAAPDAVQINEKVKADEHLLADVLSQLLEVFPEEIGKLTALVEPAPAVLHKINPGLMSALLKMKSGVLYSAAGDDVKKVVKRLLTEKKVTYDRNSGSLTLQPVDVGALAAATSPQQLGAAAAHTGVTKVSLELVGDSFLLKGEINPTTTIGTIDSQNVTDRIELAQPNVKFHSPFAVSDWEKHFDLGKSTAYADIDYGVNNKRIVKIGRGSYQLLDIPPAELIKAASEQALTKGRTSSLYKGPNVPFTLADLKVFCTTDDRLPVKDWLYTDAVLKGIISVLVGAKDLSVKQVNGVDHYYFESMPSKRVLPDDFDVRNRYYITGSGYDSAADKVKDAAMARIEKAIKLLESKTAGDHAKGTLAWNDLYSSEIVLDDDYHAAQRKVYLDKSELDADHKVALAAHWVANGYKSTWKERKDIAGISNLQPLHKTLNRSKQAGGKHYHTQFWVGPGFDGPAQASGLGIWYAEVGQKFKGAPT